LTARPEALRRAPRAQVRERQRNDPRFEFLRPWSPFNAYYRARLSAALSSGPAATAPVSETAEGAVSGGVDEGAGTEAAVEGSGEGATGAGAGVAEEEFEQPGGFLRGNEAHAVTAVASITSFGGEDESSDEGASDDGADGRGGGGAGDSAAAEDAAAGGDGAAAEEVAAAAVAGREEDDAAQRKAARLLRARELLAAVAAPSTLSQCPGPRAATRVRLLTRRWAGR
jgi:hypothetical protein